MPRSNSYASLPRPFFVLAPMDDVTDTVFRQIVADCAAPDLFFTEFVNVDGLQSPGRPRLLRKLQHAAKERPLVAQLWGKNPENYYKTALELGKMGFAGIDINMGCPVKAVVADGNCSALIANRPLAQEIIQATQAGASGLPVSVKTRLGLATIDLSWHAFLLGLNLDMLTVHGRTRQEMSLVPAQWNVIGQIRELRDRLAPATYIVGNGDVTSRAQGEKLAAQYALDGIMIGRGIFHDPYVFSPKSQWAEMSATGRRDLFRRQVELFKATWQSDGQAKGQMSERRVHTLNKFCKIYINDFDGASQLRQKLMAASSTEELLAML